MKTKARRGIPFEEDLAEYLKDPKNRELYDLVSVEIDLSIALFEAREAAGLTQAQLAKKLGTQQQIISRIEVGDQNMTISTLHRHVRALGKRLEIRLVPEGALGVRDAAPPKRKKI